MTGFIRAFIIACPMNVRDECGLKQPPAVVLIGILLLIWKATSSELDLSPVEVVHRQLEKTRLKRTGT